MAPSRRVHEKTQLVLQCEWSSCRESFNRMEDFCSHVEAHLPAAEEDKCVPLDETPCLWSDCGFCPVEGHEDLRRHLFFHCYHTRLKDRGRQVLSSKDNADLCCSVGHHNRNIIPEVNPADLVCQWDDCEQPPYDNAEWFYRHVDLHARCVEVPAGDVKCVFRCGWMGCQASVRGRHKLREHVRSHTQEKVVACPGCGGMYANNTKLFDHIRRQTDIEGHTFQCVICSKYFATERLWRDHVRIHVNRYKCQLCEMTCPSPSSLRAHVRFRHNAEKPYACDFCAYTCKHTRDLRRHLETHCSDPLYRCEVPGCGYTARGLPTFQAHHRREHEGDSAARYMCHVCQRCFTKGSILTVHLRQKHQVTWPSQHLRFRYKEHADGFLRLQLGRYESLELTRQERQKGDNSPTQTQGLGRGQGEAEGECPQEKQEEGWRAEG